MSNFVDLTGKRFDRLVVLKRAGIATNGDALWLCKCDCGNTKIYRASNLKGGRNKSCGCKHRDTLIERNWRGGYCIKNPRLHKIYKDMIARCYNKNNNAYKWYGEKGIRICDKWLENEQSFFDFCNTHGYSDSLTIDRIDSCGDYCPENCRFIDSGFNALRGVFKREFGYDGTDEEVKEVYGW